jgi:hypothetical protein
MSIEQLRTNTLLDAYFLIQNYPLRASEFILDTFIKQQYKTSLKDLCVKLLLSLTFYENNEGNLVLLFKDPKNDKLASLITYGNGAIPGSRILQIALKT